MISTFDRSRTVCRPRPVRRFRFDIGRHIAQLASLSALGVAKEVTPGTFVPATSWIPFLNPKDEDKIAPLKDTTMRANDTNVEGVWPGPAESAFAFDTYAYPNELGFLIRAMGLVDVPSVAGSTTLSAATTVGATTITTAAVVPAGTVITIGVPGAAGTEARYTINAAGGLNAPLNVAHASGAAVTYLTKHQFNAAAFPQPQPPSISITDYEEARTRGYPGCKLEQLDINIDGTGEITVSASFVGFPGQIVSLGTIAYTAIEPLIGWQTIFSLGAIGTSIVTRYLSAKYTFKRPTQAVHSCDSTQGPREVFAGDLDVTATIKAIFEDTSDADTFNNYVQTNGLTAIVADPRTSAGLVLSVAKPNFETFKPDRSGDYTMAEITVNGIFNASDGSAASLQLFAPQTTAF